MFQQTAKLSTKSEAGVWVQQGEIDLRIIYDDDVYGARILGDVYTEDEAEDSLVCNHLIAMQTVLNEVEDSLEWSALDFSLDPPSYRTFRVQFTSEDLRAEFRDIFAEGKELAEQSEILETPGDLDPEQLYYG